MNPSDFQYSNDTAFTVGSSVLQPSVLERHTLGSIIKFIRTGNVDGRDIKQTIKNLRSMDNKENQKKTKLSLPWFSGGIYGKTKNLKDLIQSNYIIIDCDNVEDIETMKFRAIEEIGDCLRFAFRSPTNGMKLVYGLDKPIKDDISYHLIYKFLAEELESKLGLKADDGAKSRAQACFFSYDPDLKENSNYTPLMVNLLLDGLTKVQKPSVQTKIIDFPGKVYNQTKPLQREFDEEEYYGPDLSSQNLADDVRASMVPLPYSSSYSFDRDYDQARELIIHLIAQGRINYEHWRKTAYALKSRFGDMGLELFLMYADNTAYNDTRISLTKYWNSLAAHNRVTFGSLVWVAEQYGWY